MHQSSTGRRWPACSRAERSPRRSIADRKPSADRRNEGIVQSTIEVVVNGTRQRVEIDTRMLLADLVRDKLRLTGTHIGCATGNCGACTVVLSGVTVKSCSVLAADVDGEEILTIEGMTPVPGELH